MEQEQQLQQDEAKYSKPSCNVRTNTSLEWGETCRRSALSERYADYLGNKLRSDMVFHVVRDNFRIPAHRLIVGAASPVLEAIAYGTGDIAGSIDARGDDDVPVHDCSADEFYEVLRFVYTGIVNLTSSSATTILQLAHYYDLQSLEAECVAFLLRMLSWRNVCDIYGQIHLLENALTTECLNLIQKNTHRLCTEGGQMNLFDLDQKALGKVFEFDSLGIDTEVVLFAELLKWGRVQCVAKDLAATAANLRHALEGRIDFIRFAAMTLLDFGECVKMVDPELFTQSEISTTFQRSIRSDGYGEANAIVLCHNNTPRTRVLPERKLAPDVTTFPVATFARAAPPVAPNASAAPAASAAPSARVTRTAPVASAAPSARGNRAALIIPAVSVAPGFPNYSDLDAWHRQPLRSKRP